MVLVFEVVLHSVWSLVQQLLSESLARVFQVAQVAGRTYPPTQSLGAWTTKTPAARQAGSMSLIAKDISRKRASAVGQLW